MVLSQEKAKRVDPSLSGVVSTANTPALIPGIQVDQGWVRNSAGFYFSNWYGFGGVDASASVLAAKNYSNYLPTQRTFSQASNYTSQIQIAEGNFQPLPMQVSATGSVEEVLLFLNISNTPFRNQLACMQVWVVSPSGTKSVLLHAGTGLQNPTVVRARILSNAFYGESLNGTWTLNIGNVCVAGSGAAVLSPSQPQQTLLFTYH